MVEVGGEKGGEDGEEEDEGGEGGEVEVVEGVDWWGHGEVGGLRGVSARESCC